MKPNVAALALIALFAAASAHAAGNIASFDGAIGSQPLRAGGAQNLVLGVAPGGAPWVIESFKAQIKEDGRITARGEGLLLAGGDSIGGRGGIELVAVSLFCKPDDPTQPVSQFDSDPVELDFNGDFEIRGSLTDGEALPEICAKKDNGRPVLLIRSANGGVLSAWFAAGILRD